MASRAHSGGSHSPRRSLLDLAPLELDCMTTLWPMGEGTVREIRDQLAPRLPRAYTTIMTIMDRLARKGVVERRKVGRAYRYRPNLSAAEAREHALGQVMESFFGGSAAAVIEQLGVGVTSSQVPVAVNVTELRPVRESARAASAAAGSSAATGIHLASPLSIRAVTDDPKESPLEGMPLAAEASVIPITTGASAAELVREEQPEDSVSDETTKHASMDPTLL